MKRTILVPVAVIAVLAVAFAIVYSKGGRDRASAVASFDECVAAGYPVQESFPERCATPDGRTFTRQVATTTNPDPAPSNPSSYKDMIRVTSVKAGDTISSPVTIKGEARGGWFFEATFPVAIASSDADGRYIAQGYAQADGEWMTTEYVPFTATVAFDPGAETEGFVVLEKSNASGLPEKADAFQIPVKFARRAGGSQAACYVGGCSGQVCSDQKDAASTCEFRPEYACYQRPFAKCERQADGQCGWTRNPQLTACLANSPAVE